MLGGLPQDLKFKGEETWVEVGDRTTIREYTTINRGTSQSFKTTVGSDCFLMTYVHLAHDCHVGNGVIISNGTQLAGHVTIEDRAIISGLCAIHQFGRIGRYCFIGGMARVNKDVTPYVKAVGNPIKLYGLNSIGLQRNGFSPESILAAAGCRPTATVSRRRGSSAPLPQARAWAGRRGNSCGWRGLQRRSLAFLRLEPRFSQPA